MTKSHAFRVEGIVVLIMAGGYLTLTILSLIKWNEAISASLVTGFCLFAQSSVSSYFRFVEKVAGIPADPVTQTITTNTTAAADHIDTKLP